VRPHVVGVIFARGGSKRVPRKNLRLLAGRPLIAYAIDAAKMATSIDRVVVSTDDLEIASVAERLGAEVPFIRPAELATDDSPEWLAWQHAIRTLESAAPGRPIQVLACVPTTSPLRTSQDIDACIAALIESDADITITVTPAARNPYFNMVTVEGGYAHLVIPPERSIHRGQDAPPVFDMTTVAYAARTDFVLRATGIFDGKVGAVVVSRARALDIDTEEELRFAEFILSRTTVQRGSR